MPKTPYNVIHKEIENPMSHSPVRCGTRESIYKLEKTKEWSRVTCKKCLERVPVSVRGEFLQ